jgi:pimeloyl-ACP methyl ester carboxylesterase
MNPPQPNNFDPANARELCAASAEAYETTVAADLSAEASAKMEQTGIWSDATDTHVLITRRDHDLSVAFRGTADPRNWLTDLDCELTRVGSCRVHRGFYEAMKAVESDLLARLGEAQGARLWVTGHSLGGALAMLWALWAAQNGHDIAGVYTFGQPRAGDAAFSQLYDSILKTRTWRSVYAEDIVPRVPWLLGRYHHAGHEVFYPSATPPWPVVDPPFWTCLPSDARGLARELRRGKLALLEDHHVRRYLALFPEPRAAGCVSSCVTP